MLQGFPQLLQLAPQHTACMNLLILTALRPHSEEQIYPELSAFLPWRLVAHSCYVHLIVTNHPKLVRFLDFSKCPQWLENILFNRVVAKDDTDASITACIL